MTSLPLSVDLRTNQLIATTPAGERNLTVLPDAAVQNMLADNVIDQLGDQTATNLKETIELENREGVAVYRLKGIKEQNLLGFIPIIVERTAVVSAETGELIEIQEPTLAKIVNILSP